jgi:DNA-binding IclR family transcriptional regulator
MSNKGSRVRIPGFTPPNFRRRSQHSVLSLLSELAASPVPLTTSELAQRTGLHRVSVYRKLESLVGEGWLNVEGSPHRYSVSWSVSQLGLLALRQNKVHEVVLIRATELAKALDAPTWFGFYEAGTYFGSGSVGLVNDVPIFVPAGLNLPPSCVSGGLILLAYQDDEEIERIANLGVPAFTDETITEPAAIIAHARKARQLGYAFSHHEYVSDLVTFSVPVFDSKGVAASLSSRCPDFGPTPEMLQVANDIAERASLELGHRVGIRSIIA